MELWLIYALLSAFFAGAHNFIFKMVAERGYNTYLFTTWDYIFATLTIALYMLPNITDYFVDYNSLLLLGVFSIVNVLFFSLSLFTRVEGMRNIDTVIFYPLYKTFGPIFITLISFFLFKELLSLKEFIGIILGICVPLMLITQSENKVQKNLFLGVSFVVITAILSSISTVGVKGVRLYDLNVELFVLMSSIIGIIISMISNKAHNYKGHKKYKSKGLQKLGLFAGVIHVLSFLFFALALSGNMAIVFTINSFSILIPIILSIIFYGEHFNMRKAIVIMLSIASILMFI